MTHRLIPFLTTTLFLLLIGALAGLVVAVLGLALDSALKSLQASDGHTLLRFLGDLFFLLISVIAVSTVAAPDGLWAGIVTAAAISVTYGIILWLLPRLPTQRRLIAPIFAVVGAVTAWYSVHGSLANYGMAAAVGGALFGVVASFSISRRAITATVTSP